ncbi:MAG: hypothetical protein ABI587_17085 [Gemmatimonadales bacterium]
MSELSLPQRAARSLAARWRTLLAHPAFNPIGRAELEHEVAGGHPAGSHREHLVEAVDWLVRAQSATPDDGIARGYSVFYSPYFRSRGWQPSYPETTGYIIPTLLEAAHHLSRSELVECALRAARWEIAIQLPGGAVQGGVIGEGRTPAIFNTGQVMLGWLAAYEATGDVQYADALRRAGNFLVSAMDADGRWTTGESDFARKDATLYNARVAWAMAEAGSALGEPRFTDAAARNLRMVASQQLPNGWFPNCCLSDPVRPLLHTIAYTIRGLLEGGRVLQDAALLGAGIRAAEALLPVPRADGWMPGRYAQDWRGAVQWSCLTGEAQMVNNWIRLGMITGESRWSEPVDRVLTFVKRTQNRTSADPGLRGGIKGSAPMSGGYGTNEILNWATKYFADALMRDDQRTGGTLEARGNGIHRLA